MKLKTLIILFTSLAFLSIFSCSSTNNKPRDPVSKITLNPSKNNYMLDETIQVNVSVDPKNGEFSNAELYIDDNLVATSSEENFSYTIENLNTVGNYQVKVVARNTNDMESTYYSSFQVFSDIIPEEYTYEIINTYPHNTNHYTQGLEIHNNEFYESTGQYGNSGIYKFDLNSGSILQSFDMEDKYFGEGITIQDDKIYQITWNAQKGFIYDLNSIARIDSFTYMNKEGWGLTHNDEYLIMSDGTDNIYYWDPNTLNVVKKIAVFTNQGPVQYLNELEYYDGYIYANVYTESYIVKIEAETGKVVAIINLEGLLPSPYDTDHVLNGIAINNSNGNMYVTGKLWSKLYEIKLVKKE